MAIAEKCPQCGSPLPAGASSGELGRAAEGLCPACLLRRGLEPNTVPGATDAAERWTPPQASDLAARFEEFDQFEFIGRGGMGAVYKARQKNLDRLVALNILPPEIGNEAAFAERFARKAQALARLNHPHIVTIHDFGRREGLFFLVMEYVDGLNLRQLLATGAVSAKEALAIVPQICEALQYAHDQGIVHRDIKPENILLSRNGTVKIADFGLAKLIGRVGAEGTATDGVMGTPRYMAPEQTERPGDVDHRADIYALGVVFYQMLTGELPSGKFEPPSRKVIIDVRLDEVVLRALERLPERRYQHASEVRTAVETIVSTPSSTTQANTSPPMADAKPARFSRTAIIGAIWALEALLAFLWMGQLNGEHVTPWQYMSGPERLGLLLTEAGWTVGILSVLGTTILGCIAISQIRRSRGSLRGLRLALLDALWYPLLGVDALVFTAAWPLIETHAIHQYGSVQHGVTNITDLVTFHSIRFLLTTALCAILNFVVVRRTWMAVKRRLYGSANFPPGAPAASAVGNWGFALGAACVALAAFTAVPIWNWVHVGEPERNRLTSERNQITEALGKEITRQLADRGMSSQFTNVDVASGLFGATVTFSDLEETTTVNGVDARRHLAGKLNLQNQGGTWLAQGDEDLQAVRFVMDAVEYPSVSVTSDSANGPGGPFPRPELFLSAVRLMPDYQDWLRTGTDHTFAENDSSGFRFEAHFIGLAAPDGSGRREELIADVKLFRPDGSLLAITHLGKAHPDHWDTDVFGQHSDKVASRLMWEANPADPEIEGGVLKEIVQFPGMPNEEDWIVDASRAAHVLPNTRPAGASLSAVASERPAASDPQDESFVGSIGSAIPTTQSSTGASVAMTVTFDAPQVPAMTFVKGFDAHDSFPITVFDNKGSPIGQGMMTRIAGAFDPNTQTLKCTAVVSPAPGVVLLPNEFVTVRVQHNTAPLVAQDVALNFADPAVSNDTFHNQRVAFSLVFTSVAGVPDNARFAVMQVGNRNWGVSVVDAPGGSHVEIHGGEQGQAVDSGDWKTGPDSFENVVRLPVQVGTKEFQCPVSLELERQPNGGVGGSYWFCAYLSGHLPPSAGNRYFELVNIDRSISFLSLGVGEPISTLGVDINGDGKINPAKDAGETFKLYETFQIGQRRFHMTQADPSTPQVTFEEVLAP